MAVSCIVAGAGPGLRNIAALTLRAEQLTAIYADYTAETRFINATMPDGGEKVAALDKALRALIHATGMKEPDERE
jgi:hypothetical protein